MYNEKREKFTIVIFPSAFPEFPAPKNENFQQFQVFYLGSEMVSKPVGENASFHAHLDSFLLKIGCVTIVCLQVWTSSTTHWRRQ